MWRRGNWRQDFNQRLGLYNNKVKQSVTNRHVIWLHAVSVGEMNVCLQVIRALQPRMPNLKIVVSTTTTTGMAELQKRLPPTIGKIYYPIDRQRYVGRALGSIHPNAIGLIESEIWPNFMWRARSLGKAVFLINARLSDRSYPRYKRFGFIFRPLFASFTAVGAQNESDAAKLRELGCQPDAVHVVGNLKFDAAGIPDNKTLDVPALLQQIGISTDAPILVAGSTHAGEERILAQQFLRLRKRFPNLVLILVPRHFERAREVAQELSNQRVKFMYRSEITAATHLAPGSVQCLLVNTTGELRYFYEYATIAFIGKSLTAKGGQNPIEPAALAKPVVFGPNMQNFSDVTKIFLAQDGAVQVRDAAELENVFADLLARPERREQLGRNAQKIVRENQGAVNRTVDLIVEHLKGLNSYVVPPKPRADGQQTPGSA
ncbi:MAG TPA: 3-deoxy-D-manno-octulosonic acid transferase [Verrucomicrobiae bacterium]|nr:3-deoxy-D-manno-octulosonic acid transferase [Verrucomicrobiae bacterium]